MAVLECHVHRTAELYNSHVSLPWSKCPSPIQRQSLAKDPGVICNNVYTPTPQTMVCAVAVKVCICTSAVCAHESGTWANHPGFV